jgi:hypothetical protein
MLQPLVSAPALSCYEVNPRRCMAAAVDHNNNEEAQ